MWGFCMWVSNFLTFWCLGFLFLTWVFYWPIYFKEVKLSLFNFFKFRAKSQIRFQIRHQISNYTESNSNSDECTSNKFEIHQIQWIWWDLKLIWNIWSKNEWIWWISNFLSNLSLKLKDFILVPVEDLEISQKYFPCVYDIENVAIEIEPLQQIHA